MFDLIIKNAKTVTGDSLEIGVTDGKITVISEKLYEEGRDVLTLKDSQFLSAGWIDSHVHCYEKMSLYYDFPDEIGIKKGVTTVIDAGSTGADNIGDFHAHAIKAKTDVLALINISKTGIVKQDELADMERLSEESIKNAINKYPDFIIGLKARMSASVIGENGLEPLIWAKRIQKATGDLPLMVHIGSAPPELSDILKELEAGDIVTHCFNGKENGILASDDSIKSFVFDAYEKGIIFDIGHGTDSFNFHVAEIAFKEKLKAATISTDIYHRNREDGPVHDLATTLEKLLEVGYNLPELIEKITVKPAEYFDLTGKGRLEVGADADFTVFSLNEERKTLTDSNGNTRQVKKQIIPELAIVGGEIYNAK
ncbi:amidohydrolase/deacetylase family metallohydrolase [Vagococcus sp. PNs007]|uniref:Amidohydrolase/deacetylase family metallohydrolase n=1 Tax=Vagococcus proximus TaxID=2991417 RepID=A0ABT5WY93_9ENTE|nr:amidohydrolase/deacetylase family metallohydrolase [Vagococcus proximus]MDF0478712.1 amidohydrolase/deacetylase family metallohydrolase [Vagococcus proximus]